MNNEDHLSDPVPAGFIEVNHDLMPYWTRDGRSIEEIWEEHHGHDDGLEEGDGQLARGA